MMSDNISPSKNTIGNTSGPRDPIPLTPDEQSRAPHAAEVDESSADLHEKLHVSHGPEQVPEELRLGAIAWRFGADDIDAVHAKALREVQNTAAVRYEWVGDAVAHDLEIGDPRWKWALYPNGVEDDVRIARRDAEHAGLADADIDAAEALGSEGVPWSQQPSHHHLGRIDLLSSEAYAAKVRSDSQQRLVYSFADRLQETLGVLDDVRQGAARAETMLATLANDLAATGLLNRAPADTPAPGPAQPEPQHTTTASATRNVPDGRASTAESPPEGGHRIGDAVGAALVGGSAWSSEEPAHPSINDRESAANDPEVGR
ncbi:hypothetical protein ABIA39_007534 [Nocardia sp. GAS34]|uniref:hypothetical protein n=1 Tax=unclassified Nocardia TaxID=2637762 RepID=UPI003D1D3E88